MTTPHAAFGLAVAATLLPCVALAQSGPEGPLRPVVDLAVADTDGGTWLDGGIGLGRTALISGDGWRLADSRLLVRERPGLSELAVSLDVAGPDGWMLGGGLGPDDGSLARSAVRVGRVGRIETAGAVLVPGLTLSARDWSNATLVSLAPSLEYYPRGAPWYLTGSASLGSLDGAFTAGGQITARVPVSGPVGAWVGVSGGREIEAGAPLDVTAVSAGLEWTSASGRVIGLGLEREQRDGVDARISLRLRLSGGN